MLLYLLYILSFLVVLIVLSYIVLSLLDSMIHDKNAIVRCIGYILAIIIAMFVLFLAFFITLT